MDTSFGAVDGPAKIIHVHEPAIGVLPSCAGDDPDTKVVLDAAKTKGIPPRQAAVELATARVREAMSYRRFSLL